jgi:hypothetical protein
MALFPAADLRPMRIVAGGMLAAAILFLGIAMAMRTYGGMGGSLEIVTWLASVFALVSPVTGMLMASQAARSGAPAGSTARRTAFLVHYGQMEGAVMFCGVALLVGTNAWPLAAALVPLAIMATEFPRPDVPRTG